MTRDDARTIWLALLTVVIVSLGIWLLITRSQVGAADLQIHRLADGQARAAAAQAQAAAAQATSALAVGVSAQQLAAAIQQNRLGACDDQNRRHDATILALHRLFSPPLAHVKTRAQRAGVRRTQRAVRLIFDAAVPKRNCPTFIVSP